MDASQLHLFTEKLASSAFLPRLRHCSYSVEQAATDISAWLNGAGHLGSTFPNVTEERYDALLKVVADVNRQLEKRGISATPHDFAEQFKLAFEQEKLYYYRYC